MKGVERAGDRTGGGGKRGWSLGRHRRSDFQQPARTRQRRLQRSTPSAAQPQFGGEVLVAMSEETKDGFGLDKEQRLLAKRLGKEEEEADLAAGLEPPFPYVMARFDAGYFEV